MTCIRAFIPRRAVLHSLAVGVGTVALLFIAVALLWPGYWKIGSITVSLHNTRNLSYLAEGSLLIWLATSARTPQLIRAIRKTLNWQRQLVTAVLALNVVVAVGSMLTYPQNLTDNFRGARDDVAERVQIKYGRVFVPLENVAARCCADLPPDARILYHGFQEGWVFASAVYPRRVFMLPSQWWRVAASCHLKPWFQYLPKDPLEIYWKREVTPEPTERENFIRAHDITHEVFYDAENPSALPLGGRAMIGAICVLGYVIVLGGAGAAIAELLSAAMPRENAALGKYEPMRTGPGWGWSFLIGTAAMGAVLYLPLAVTGRISHAMFLTTLVGACLLGGWWLWRHRHRAWFANLAGESWPADLSRVVRWLGLAIFAAAAISTLFTPPTGFDGRAIFVMKARLLYDHGNLADEDFQDVDRMHFNAHYPLLLPLVEAQWFWLQGSTSDTQLRFIFVAYIAALASIVARQLKQHTTPRIAALATALLLCVPVVIQANEGAGLTSSADLPLACYVTAGAFAMMSWLRQRSRRQAVLAGLMFGAGALTKTEGMLWIAASMTSVLLVLAARPSQLNRAFFYNGLVGASVLALMLGLQMAVRERIPFSPYLRSYSAALSWDWLRLLASRPWAVATFGLGDCLRPTVWNLTWPSVGAVMFLRRKQPATTEIWLGRLLVGMVAAALFAILVITPYHVYWQIATALHRLVLQLLPLAWVLAVEQLSASGLIGQLSHVWNADSTSSVAALEHSEPPDSSVEQLTGPSRPLRRAG